jgi:acyl-CoA thioester hydrolase
MGQPFVWQVRVYWEDTDGGGVVYHAQYLNFFERARTEWLRSLGLDQSELADVHGIVFSVRHMDIDFVLAARLDDELRVSARPVTLGAARVGFEQEIRRVRDDVLLASARVQAACLSAADYRPARLPDWIRQKMTGQTG